MKRMNCVEDKLNLCICKYLFSNIFHIHILYCIFVFSRQRQHRLEEEQADIEFKIRCLIMIPDANKTDVHKTREEELLKKLE